MTKIDIGKSTLEEYKAGLRPRSFSLVPDNLEFETRLRDSLSELGEQLTKEEIKEAVHTARRDLNFASKSIELMGDRNIELQLIGRKLNIFRSYAKQRIVRKFLTEFLTIPHFC